MTGAEFTKHSEKLFGYFNKTPTKVMVDAWFEEFGGLPEYVMHESVLDAISNSRYMPTMSEFKKIVARHRRPAAFRAGGVRGDVPDDPELSEAEKELNRIIVPKFISFLNRIPFMNKERREQEFERLMTELFGNACRLGLRDKIAWEEFDGQHGFKLPATWSNRALSPSLGVELAPDHQEDD